MNITSVVTSIAQAARKVGPKNSYSQADVLKTARGYIKKISQAHTKAEKEYLAAKAKRDIIRTSCAHEKVVRIKNYLELAKEVFGEYLLKKSANIKDVNQLFKHLSRFATGAKEMAEEARSCEGQEIVVISKPKVTESEPYRSCFRQPGLAGTPRIAFVEGKAAGFGIKGSFGVEYVSSWMKNAGRADGARMVFNLGLAGINLTGGRWGHAVFLLGISAGVGIGTLYTRNGAGDIKTLGETTPRVGLDLHIVAFAKGYVTLMMRGGYQMSKTYDEETEETQKLHGGYGGLGLEFYIPGLSKLVSPELNVNYTGYEKGRHEVSLNLILRI